MTILFWTCIGVGYLAASVFVALGFGAHFRRQNREDDAILSQRMEGDEYAAD